MSMDLYAAERLVDAYNKSFATKDIKALRRLYVESGPFTYFDNHANCDSTDLDDHLKKVDAFFQSGNDIPGLDTEILSVNANGNVACITAKTRYRGKSELPQVRLTLVAECIGDEWKIRHLHYSNQPC